MKAVIQKSATCLFLLRTTIVKVLCFLFTKHFLYAISIIYWGANVINVLPFICCIPRVRKCDSLTIFILFPNETSIITIDWFFLNYSNCSIFFCATRCRYLILFCQDIHFFLYSSSELVCLSDEKWRWLWKIAQQWKVESIKEDESTHQMQDYIKFNTHTRNNGDWRRQIGLIFDENGIHLNELKPQASEPFQNKSL